MVFAYGIGAFGVREIFFANIAIPIGNVSVLGTGSRFIRILRHHMPRGRQNYIAFVNDNRASGIGKILVAIGAIPIFDIAVVGAIGFHPVIVHKGMRGPPGVQRKVHRNGIVIQPLPVVYRSTGKPTAKLESRTYGNG